MFYTVISRDGFCHIPTVTVIDEDYACEYQGQVFAQQPITRDFVSGALSKTAAVKFVNETFEGAETLAREIYKKMPRFCRQLGYMTEEDGAGVWESEVADRYL